MSPREFESWERFYREHPFSDAHRFHRPAALVSASMAGGDMGEKLKWLRDEARLDPADIGLPGEFSDADRATFKALGMKMPG